MDFDIRPRMEERTIELDGGIVRKVEDFAEFIRQNEGEVCLDHVIEHLVARVLNRSEGRDYRAFRAWQRERRDCEADDVERSDGNQTEETNGDAPDGSAWAEETGEMTTPVTDGDPGSGGERPKTRRIQRDPK